MYTGQSILRSMEYGMKYGMEYNTYTHNAQCVRATELLCAAAQKHSMP